MDNIGALCFCLAIMASQWSQLGPNGRAICLTKDCNRESKSNWEGFCSYSCWEQAAKGNLEVDASEVPECAILQCQKQVKPSKTHYKPFCSYTCEQEFEGLLKKIEDYRENSMSCPLCGGWTYFSDEKYTAAQWMSWHLTADHYGRGHVDFVKNVQLACCEWFPQCGDLKADDTPKSLVGWYRRWHW